MLKSLLESINREVVTENDEDLMADNIDTSIRDAYLDEDGDLLPNDVTEAKIKDLIENLPETDSNGITKDEIKELSESYTDIFDEHNYVFEGAVEVPDKLTDLKKKVKALEKKEKLSIADKAKLAKYQAQINVLSKIAKKKGVKEASSELYADDEEIVDQYKGSAKNERTTPELYADKEEIIDQGTYEDTEIDLTEESFGYDDFETSMEGTTYDSIKIGMSKDKKDADKLFKSAKKNCKDGKYSDAIKDIEKAKSIYNKLEKELSKLDDDMAGTICSSLLTGFPLSEIYAICSGVGQSSMHKKNIVSYVLGAVASTVGNAIGGVGAGSMLGRAARIGAQVIDNKSGEPKNPTKAKTIECMREAVKQCDDVIAEIKKSRKSVKEGSSLYADNEEINDQYKSSFNNTRTTKDLYADDEEIKDVGVYEEDELDLTDLDDDIEGSCKEKCGTSSESADMYADNQEINDQYKSSPNIQRTGNNNYADNQEIKDVGVYEDDDLDLTDLDDDIECGNNCGSTMEVKGEADEDIDLDLTAEEAFELELLEANLYADDEPVEDKYKTSPSGKIEHEDYYADNQEIKDVGIYESDDNGETPEADEADPGENLAEESLLIDLLDLDI